MIKTKQEFKEKMEEINAILTQMLIFFVEENSNDKQFDFVNTPNMPIETMIKKAKTLEKKWFQEEE
jgi:hypothetical protein